MRLPIFVVARPLPTSRPEAHIDLLLGSYFIDALRDTETPAYLVYGATARHAGASEGRGVC